MKGPAYSPVESVLYAIEVKSKLSLEELKRAEAGAKRLEQLRLLQVKNQTARALAPLSILLAFDSDLKGEYSSELDRYLTLIQGSPFGLAALCVVGKGYWFWDTRTEKWDSTVVGSASHEYQYQEVVEFVAGIMNTYPDIAASRGNPPLGWYLL